jgi:hypothetical protein
MMNRIKAVRPVSFDGATTMNVRNPRPGKPLPVREVAGNAYTAILLDAWPSPAGVMDFGIDSSEHFEALKYEIRNGRISPEQLDDALGWGPALTKLIRTDNPYHGVTFKTKWDDIMVPIREWASVDEELFPLGRLFATPDALNVATRAEIAAALGRHAAGDWGDIDDTDRAANDAAVTDVGRLLSVYRSPDGQAFRIETAADRSATTVLLPEEY